MKSLPTLRQLRYLLAVAEHGHFGHAAEDCHVTQSTLSAGLRELEATLGVTLVSRAPRHVMLTPVGEEVARRAAALLREADALVDAAAASTEPLSGLVRLGVIPTVGPYLLPGCLPILRARYPRLRLYLREDQTARLLDALWRGRLDAVIIALPYDVGTLRTTALGEDPLLLACPADHPAASSPSLTMDSLKGERWLLLEDGHCLRNHALTACHLVPGQANEDFQATSLGTLVHMVANGLGLTLIPGMAVAVETGRDPAIRVRQLEDQTTGRTIVLGWLPGTPRSKDFEHLATELRAHMAALALPIKGTS